MNKILDLYSYLKVYYCYETKTTRKQRKEI